MVLFLVADISLRLGCFFINENWVWTRWRVMVSIRSIGMGMFKRLEWDNWRVWQQHVVQLVLLTHWVKQSSCALLCLHWLWLVTGVCPEWIVESVVSLCNWSLPNRLVLSIHQAGVEQRRTLEVRMKGCLGERLLECHVGHIVLVPTVCLVWIILLFAEGIDVEFLILI